MNWNMDIMAWLFLFMAGVMEVIWLQAMKQSNGFKNWRSSLLSIVAASASFFLLALSLNGIPVGTAYAVWTGIGAVGTAVIGIIIFGEQRNFLTLLSLGLIILGILGLRLST